jgi:hypothetical protein
MIMSGMREKTWRIAVVSVCLVAVVAISPPATAETLWLNLSKAYARDSGQLEVRQVDGNGTIELQAIVPGTSLWLTSPTMLPSYVEIQSVTVCYELSDPTSFLSQIRLVEMREPLSASVKIDDTTDRTDPGPACVTTSGGGGHHPNGVAGLSLRFEFSDTEDIIRIGGVGINYEIPAVDIPERNGSSNLALRQNFPNPFASSTTIEFQVARPGPVELRIYKPTGQLVRKLVAGERPAGIERIVWDGRDDDGRELAAGVYFYRVRVGGEMGAKRMVMAR